MFVNIRFPTSIRYGCVGGPSFKTDTVEFDNGSEQRDQRWSEARRIFEVAKGTKTDDDRKALIAFFRIIRGKRYSFRIKDFTDYEVETGEGAIAALGNSQFQLYKRHTYGAETSDEIITLPLSVVLKQGATTLTESVHYTLGSLTGIATMLGSPTIVPTTWTGEYDVRARFDTDAIRLVHDDIAHFISQSIPIVEARYEEEAP